MKNSVDHSKLNSLPVVVRGTGSIGLRHLSVLKEVGAEPIAFPARRGEDRAELQQYITVNNFQAVADKQIAAAIVATDTAHHLADAIELIRAGCNVLIEKPLAASRDGLVELESAAAAHRREVFTGCCLRFHPGLQKFRQLLPQLGSVHHVRVECSSYLPDWRPSADYRRSYSASVEQGGVLRDLIHEID
jgi:predicted dehydrogenase